MTGLTLDTIPADQQISLDSSTPVPPPQPVSQARAAKADMGLGNITGQNYDQIYNQISGGQEDQFRQGAAATIDQKAYDDRQKALTALAAQKGRNLTLDEVQQTLSGTPTNPDTVIEKAYAQNYTNQIHQAANRMESPILTDAQTEDPEAVDRYFSAGSDILSRLEYARKVAEDAAPGVYNDAWFHIPFPDQLGGDIAVGSYNAPISSALNIATLGTYGGLRNEVLMRGNTPETSRLNGIFEANNVRQQALELLRQPTFDDFKKLFDKGYERVKYQDPAAAMQWAQSIAGMSTDEMITRDAMSAANLTILGGAIRTIKGLIRGPGTVPGTTPHPPGQGPVGPSNGTLTRGADGVYRPASPAVQTALNVVDDVLRAAPPSPTKGAVAEATGDLHEAAVQKTIQSKFVPDPQRDATDTLMSTHRVQRQLIEANPGNLSREAHTRMLDAADGYDKDLVDLIENTTKIVRNPILTEEGFRSVNDDIRQYFRGKENTILDVEHFHEPVTNTDHFRFTLGDYDGGPFISKQQALNAAENRGYGKPEIIGEEPDTVYLPRQAVLSRPFPISQPDKFEPNPNFQVQQKGGQHRFIISDNGLESEVIPRTKPEPFDIPYNLKTNKFGQPYDPKNAPELVQKGLGFYLRWTVPFDETQPFALDRLIGKRTRSLSTGGTRAQDYINGMLGYLRLPADTLSHADNENRIKAVYTQNRYLDLLKNQMKSVDKMSGNKDFLRALTVAQKATDPETKLPGYYMKTPAEIQDFWLRTFHRPATEEEQSAYLAVQRMNHADLVFRSIAQYKNKSRLGVMEHTLTSYKNGKKIISQPFEGRMIQTVPSTDKVVAIHESDGSIKLLNALNTEYRKQFINKFKQGQYRGIQLYDPDKYPIKVFDSEGNHVRVVYVFSSSVDSQPISYRQIKYRGGGHWDYVADRYMKQPIIRKEIVGGKTRWIYAGDATFAPMKGNDTGFLDKINKVVSLLDQKKIAEAKALHQSFMDQKWKDFVRHFYPRKNKDTGELEPSRFNTKEPFRIIPKGTTVGDYDKTLIQKYRKLGRFIDTTRQESLAKNFQVEFTGARDSYDLFEPNNVGSVSQPMYKLEPAKLTDPIVTLHRALDRIVKSLYMDDEKISAMTHWLEENKDMLSDQELIRSSPFYVFHQGELTKATRYTLRGQTAESNRYKIKKFLGMPTWFDTQLHTLKQSIADDLFNADTSTLKGKATKALIVPDWMLSNVHSGPNFVRAMAFHQNLGIWNWQQLAAQQTAYLNFFALSPNHAIPGVFGALMHQWSRLNRRVPILRHLGQLAEQLHIDGRFVGWKPGEWEEAMRAYERTGFDKIGNTLAIDYDKTNFGISNTRRLARASSIFFDLAERNVRDGSFYTAYHEFKRAYPTRKIDDSSLGQILRRANDMYANMGRDSKTVLNTGILSMTLQFFKYQENNAHLFLGKRIGDVFGKENSWKLRAAQRARMILMYSLAFGALGSTGLSLLPINDEVRKYEIEHGYVPGQNTTSTLLMEGPLAMAGAYASGWWRTGNLDMSKGTFYNFNDRYGTNGYQILRDLLEPDNTFWKIVFGASGSTIANNFASISPFVYAWKSAINDEQDNPFPLTLSDWMEGLDNINSFRYARRLEYALQFGKWLDRHGRPTEDIGKIDAIFRTLLGTNDQRIDDKYLKGVIQREERQNVQQAAQDFLHYRTLAEQAAMNGDDQQALVFNKKANFVLQSRDIPYEDLSAIMAKDAQVNTDTLKQTDDSFFLKHVPPSMFEERRAAYRAIHGTPQNPPVPVSK